MPPTRTGLGRFDRYCANAWVTHCVPFQEMAESLFEEIMVVNLKGCI
ncbi:MAG: hypothetical protein WA888_16800 [Burkholderiaceae bacterium]